MEKTGIGQDIDSISLQRILEAFNAPVNEEQAWAVCYQCAQYFKSEKDTDSHRRGFADLEAIEIGKDGKLREIVPSSDDVTPARSAELIRSLGVALFQALDYGLSDKEEHSLSGELEELISSMTDSGADEEGDQDEGIEDEDSVSPKDGITLDDVLQACERHVLAQGRSDPAVHYRAVCRALVAEALELITFLEKVATNKECLKTVGQPDRFATSEASSAAKGLEDLQTTDWTRLWMQIMRELRAGVTLKKVTVNDHTKSEFTFTPYEMLMKDIRDRRHHLKATPPKLPPATKQTAQDLILDFIRSRPPLHPVKDRILKDPPVQLLDPREQLLRAIRSDPHLRLTPTPTPIVSPSDGPAPKRLIKANFTLFDSDESDNDESEEEEEGRTHVTAMPFSPTSPLSPSKAGKTWIETVPSPTSASPPPTTVSPAKEPRATVRRSASMRVEGSVGPNKAFHDSLPITEQCAKMLALPPNFQPATGQTAFHSLALTVEEVMHIREVLTKAELETLLVNRTLHDAVEKGKVCFTCKVTQFTWFGCWPITCKFCKRSVCSDCITKMQIPREHFENVPVYTLGPLQSVKSFPFDLAPFDRSGSAPNSPQRSLRSSPNPSQLSQGTANHLQGSKSTPHTVNGELGTDQQASDQKISTLLSKPRRKVQRSQTVRSPTSPVYPQLNGPQMDICIDCKALVVNIIRSSQAVLGKARSKPNSGSFRSSMLTGVRGAHLRSPDSMSSIAESPNESNRTTRPWHRANRDTMNRNEASRSSSMSRTQVPASGAKETESIEPKTPLVFSLKSLVDKLRASNDNLKSARDKRKSLKLDLEPQFDV